MRKYPYPVYITLVTGIEIIKEYTMPLVPPLVPCMYEKNADRISINIYYDTK